MCHNCNQTNDCNCNNTVPCQKCNTPACNNVCRFTGENIDGLNITKNEDISTSIEKIAEFVLNLVSNDQSIVKLQSSISTTVKTTNYPVISNSSILDWTSYSVSINSGAEYDVYFEGKVRFEASSEIILGIFKNGVIQGFIQLVKSVANTVIPLSFSVSDLLLLPGDTIDIRASKTDNNVHLENCTIKIVKR